MAIFKVIRKSDGVEIFRYTNDVAVEWAGMGFDICDHVALPADPAPPPPPPPPPVKITKLAFRSRFTPTEKAAIEMAALDNQSASMQARGMAAGLRASLADQRDAAYIDLMRADTRAGVQMLEALGIIAAGRAAVILDTPAGETEHWNGQ
jgi:hypothetical protein